MVAFRVLTFDRNPKEKPCWGKKETKKERQKTHKRTKKTHLTFHKGTKIL